MAGCLYWRNRLDTGSARRKSIIENLKQIQKIENPMDEALEIFLFCAGGPFFYDGNKRLSTLMANKVMIENGIGVFSIPIKYYPDFYKMLICFYETGQKTELKDFMYNNCIDGINFRPISDIGEEPKHKRHR